MSDLSLALAEDMVSELNMFCKFIMYNRFSSAMAFSLLLPNILTNLQVNAEIVFDKSQNEESILCMCAETIKY